MRKLGSYRTALLDDYAILRRSQVLAGVVGLASIAVLFLHLYSVMSRLQETAKKAEEDLAGNPFGQLASAPLDAIQVQSGFGCMLIGAALLVLGGFMSKYRDDSMDNVPPVSRGAGKSPNLGHKVDANPYRSGQAFLGQQRGA